VAGVQLNVPEQRAIPGVDTRPDPLRAWLGALPYVDFENAAAQVLERLRDINHQRIPAVLRLELLAAFRHSYERLHEGLRGGTRQQDPQQRMRALELHDQLAEALAFGHKYALRDALAERQRWGRARQLAEATHFSLYFLGLQLLCHYQAYRPAPDAVWREIGKLVRFAETQELPATDTGGLPYTQDRPHALAIYRQLVLLRLADPYRLPNGLVWEAYGYLAGKSPQIHLLNEFLGGSSTDVPAGVYGVSLDREPQRSLAAPGSGIERSSWRWLDARALLRDAQLDLDRILSGTHPHRAGFSNRLAGPEAIQLLGRMLGQWTHPAERKSPRFNSTQAVELAPGLAAAYYFLNNCSAFDPREFAADDDDAIDYSAGFRRPASSRVEEFRLVTCPARNRSNGGLALRLESVHELNLRVGDLVLLNTPGSAPDALRDWLVGVVRWLVRQDGAGTDLGIQYVARNAAPVAVRALSGPHQGHGPALKHELSVANGQRLAMLITPRGMYRPKAVLELDHAGQTVQIRCGHLLETAGGFDRFSYDLLG
jgi:hypothetical protein